MGAKDQAARLRQIRTHARNALLKVKIFLSKWDELAKEGRSQLEAVCNTINAASTWPLICTHALKGCQLVQPSGTRAICRRYVSAKLALRECVDHLRTIVHDTTSVVHTQLDLNIDGPLFSCVNGKQFFDMLHDVMAKHQEQLKVR